MGQDRHLFRHWKALAGPARRWTRALQSPEAANDGTLRDTLSDITNARAELDRAALRLKAELLGRGAGGDAVVRPERCDWADRPAPWREPIHPRGRVNLASPTGMGAGVTLFHDAVHADLSVRQDPVPPGVTGAQFGLVFEFYRFDGSFLSIVQDLPEAALQGLTRDHFLSLRLVADREHQSEIYARLNVQHGPNTDQLVRQVAMQGQRGLAEFDLAYSEVNEKRLEKAWIDLIFEGPEMNRIAVWDMVLTRAPRADL